MVALFSLGEVHLSPISVLFTPCGAREVRYLKQICFCSNATHSIWLYRNGGSFDLIHFSPCCVLAMAALDSISELNTLLDNWRREDQENSSPVNTLQRFVLVRPDPRELNFISYSYQNKQTTCF